MSQSRTSTEVVDAENPVFIVGMGRSGTTMLFDCLGTHPDLGWPSQYLNRAPKLPALALLSRGAEIGGASRPWVKPAQGRGLSLRRMWPGPSEAVLLWRNWCGDRFVSDFMLGEEPGVDEARDIRKRVRRSLRWQGKLRFAAKFTGPLRIQYLLALFPDARFLHIVRDPRAVVNSLMHVDFWNESLGLREPAWSNGLTEDDLSRWEDSSRSPFALSALQWRAVVKLGREEAAAVAPERYAELRYEDLLSHPREAVSGALEFFRLPPTERIDRTLGQEIAGVDQSMKWRQELAATDIAHIEDMAGDVMEIFDYGEHGPQPRRTDLIAQM